MTKAPKMAGWGALDAIFFTVLSCQSLYHCGSTEAEVIPGSAHFPEEKREVIVIALERTSSIFPQHQLPDAIPLK